MDDQLLGYLLKALDVDETARVELLLAGDPTAQARLVALRRLLEPLAADAAPCAPPSGLAQRTLEALASLPPKELPAPPRGGLRRGAGHPSRWRHADVLVAATLMLCVLGLGFPWVYSLRHRDGGVANWLGCQNNLLHFGIALKTYADQNGRRYPNLARVKPPRNVVALVAPILKDSGAPVSADMVYCPSLPLPSGVLKPVKEVLAMDAATYQAYLASVSNCYAYSLGYQQGGRLVGLTRDQDKPHDLVPVMADCPPADVLSNANSGSHRGAGQNVLFMDGHVKFSTIRDIGIGKDDIYKNHHGKVARGVDQTDSVLGHGSATPDE